MRGEDTSLRICLYLTRETPPHAWGRPRPRRTVPWRTGNTPTCVGKTRPFLRLGGMNWKHPHMRGEDSHSFPSSPAASETPPHAWGRQSSAELFDRFLGNTPTCVGKTERTSSAKLFFWKHPHMRGEDCCVKQWLVQFVETPPHAWGRRVIR